MKIKIERIYQNDKEKTKFAITQEYTVTISHKEKNEKTIFVTMASGFDFADKLFFYYLHDMFLLVNSNKFCLDDNSVESIGNEKDDKNPILNFNVVSSKASFKKYKIH